MIYSRQYNECPRMDGCELQSYWSVGKTDWVIEKMMREQERIDERRMIASDDEDRTSGW